MLRREQGLAAARLAHDAEHRAAREVEAHVVHRRKGPVGRLDDGPEVANAEEDARLAGCSSRVPLAGIEMVAEKVPHDVDREYYRHEHEAGKDHDPPRGEKGLLGVG